MPYVIWAQNRMPGHQYPFKFGFSSDSWHTRPWWEPRYCEWHYFNVRLLCATGYGTGLMKSHPTWCLLAVSAALVCVGAWYHQCSLIPSGLDSWAQLARWVLWCRPELFDSCFHTNEPARVPALNPPSQFCFPACSLPRLLAFRQPWLKAG